MLHENSLTKLPESIGNLRNLQILNLETNKLTELPESLLKLENLRQIVLQDNPLDTKTFGKTPTEEILSELKKKGTQVVRKGIGW
jgi:Leucine-rich repeat (LRR) protein